MKKLGLVLSFFLISTLLSVAQRVDTDPVSPVFESNGLINVSPKMFFTLEEWVGKQGSKRKPLRQFLLDQELPEREIEVLYHNMQKNGGDGDGPIGSGPVGPTGPVGPGVPTEGQGFNEDGNCYCVPITVEPSIFLSQPFNPMFNDDDSWGPNWLGNEWNRDYDYNREGASQYHRLYMDGNERGIEYTSQDQESEARFYFLYLCRDSNDQPCNDVDCDKDLHVRADYNSFLRTEVDSWGIWSDGAFGSAEDAVLFYQWDVDTPLENFVANENILGASYAGVEMEHSDSWNPEAFVNLIDLAAIIAGVVVESLNQDSTSTSLPINQSTIDQLASELQEIITTPFVLTSGQNGVSTDDNSLSFEGLFTLRPNIVKTISLTAIGQVYGRGYGGHWFSENLISSCFAMTAVLDYSNEEPRCCVEKSAAWATKCYDSDFAPWPPEEGAEQVGTFLGVFESVSDQTDDYLDINFNELGHDSKGDILIPYDCGLALSETQCGPVCTDIADLDIQMNTRYCSSDSIVANMLQSINVQQYQVNLYKSSAIGGFQEEVFSTNPTGDYTDGSPGILPLPAYLFNNHQWFILELHGRGFCSDHTTATFHFRVVPEEHEDCTGGEDPPGGPGGDKPAGDVAKSLGGNNLQVSPWAENIQLFPNPARDQVTLSLTPSRVMRVGQITGLNGQVLRTFNVLPDLKTQVIETSSLEPGVYILTIYEANQLVDHTKLVILR